MADFQAAVNVIDATTSTCWLQLSDISNYTTNTQNQHALADFTGYFKVKVIRPNTTFWCYSSLTGCDVDVLNPALAIFNGVYNFLQNDINGTYTIQLCTVPEFGTAETPYSVNTNDVVWFVGQLYAAQVAATVTDPGTGLPEWLAISEAQLEANYPQYCVTTPTVVDCLSNIAFQMGSADMDVDDACLRLDITDGANYTSNDENGHAEADFTDYRKATLVRPDASEYVYSSLGDGDEVISAPSSGNHNFVYNFLESDSDGIYEIQICAYPTYDNAETYDTSPDPEVVYNPTDGLLYKSLVNANVGNQPDLSATQWELYEPSGDSDLTTRYCTVFKIVVLCRTILTCRESLIHDAFCTMDTDFCNDDVLCQNTTFLAAVKLRLVLDAMEYSVDKGAWNEVERQINFAKTICNC